MNEEELSLYAKTLKSFRDTYDLYLGSVSRSYGTSNDTYRTKLHELIPQVTRIVAIVHGGGEYYQDDKTYSFYAN